MWHLERSGKIWKDLKKMTRMKRISQKAAERYNSPSLKFASWEARLVWFLNKRIFMWLDVYLNIPEYVWYSCSRQVPSGSVLEQFIKLAGTVWKRPGQLDLKLCPGRMDLKLAVVSCCNRLVYILVWESSARRWWHDGGKVWRRHGEGIHIAFILFIKMGFWMFLI